MFLKRNYFWQSIGGQEWLLQKSHVYSDIVIRRASARFFLQDSPIHISISGERVDANRQDLRAFPRAESSRLPLPAGSPLFGSSGAVRSESGLSVRRAIFCVVAKPATCVKNVSDLVVLTCGIEPELSRQRNTSPDPMNTEIHIEFRNRHVGAALWCFGEYGDAMAIGKSHMMKLKNKCLERSVMN